METYEGWGAWGVLDREVGSAPFPEKHLVIGNERNGCKVELDRCDSSAAILDWVVHVLHHERTRDVTRSDVGDLLFVLDDLLELQWDGVCAAGMHGAADKKIDATVRALVVLKSRRNLARSGGKER